MLRMLKERLLHCPLLYDLILVNECIFSQKSYKTHACAVKRYNVEHKRRIGAQKAVGVVVTV